MQFIMIHYGSLWIERIISPLSRQTLRMIKMICNNVEFRIRNRKDMITSVFFDISLCVNQREQMSPLLLILFIHDINE